MVVHTSKQLGEEDEAGGSWVQDQPELHFRVGGIAQEVEHLLSKRGSLEFKHQHWPPKIINSK
jgi:hypothetical protein